MLGGGAALRALIGLPVPAETEPDWNWLHAEGLGGLTSQHCLSSGQSLPPDRLDVYRQAVAFEMRCASVLTTLSETAPHLSMVVFKGCALAFGLYPAPGQRPFGDIDLAVPPEQRDQLHRVLGQLDFKQGSLENTFSRNGLELDVHEHPLHQFAPLLGPKSYAWWDRLEILSPRTGGILRLAWEHEFVLALMHAAKHSFARCSWLADILLLAHRVCPKQLGWAVSHYRAERQLRLAGELLKRFFELDLPPELRPAVRLNAWERHYLRLIEERRAPDFLGMLTPLSSASHPGLAVRYLMRSLYPPSQGWWSRTRQLLDMLAQVVRG